MKDAIVLTPEGAGQTSSSLLVRVQARDAAAWDRFERLYRPLVVGWGKRFGLQEADAEDVAQEVFRAVHRTIADFRRDKPGALHGWLRTITRNKVTDLARRAGREARGGGGSDALDRLLAVPDDPPSEGPTTEEARLLVRQAIDQVLAGWKDHTRQAFWLVVVDGRRPDEVAAELGIAVGSVYLAKSRVLKQLREEFADLIDLERHLGIDRPGGG